MAGLPAALLLVFSLIIWFLKAKHIRTVWIVTLTAFMIAWLVVNLLTQFLPAGLMVSNWQAETGFLESLRFELNSDNVVLIAAALNLGVVAVFTYQGAQDRIDPSEFALMTTLGGFGLLTIIPANFPTFATMWVGWEVVTNLVGIPRPRASISFRLPWRRIIQRLVSVLLVIIIGIMLAPGRDGQITLSAGGQNGLLLLGILTVLLRLDLIRDDPDNKLEGVLPSKLMIWIRGISAVSGFAFFGQLFREGTPESVETLMVAVGISFCLLSTVRIVLRNDIIGNLNTLALAILGVGLILLRTNPEIQTGTMETLSAILLLSVSAMIVPDRFQPWGQISAIAAGVIALGAPFSLGSHLTDFIVGMLQTGRGAILAVTSGIFLALISLIPLRFQLAGNRVGRAERGSTGISGMFIPVFIFLNGMILGIVTGARINVGSLVYFATSTVILGLLVYVSIKRRIQFQIPIPSSVPGKVISLVGLQLKSLGNMFVNVTEISARVFEGRAGLLWVYVILLFILVALGYTG